jgi:hypothetical protein
LTFTVISELNTLKLDVRFAPQSGHVQRALAPVFGPEAKIVALYQK